MSDEEERAFLQRRLALFAKVAFFIALVGDLLDVATSPLHEALYVGALGDRLATLVFAGMWLACARGTRSVRLLRTIEALGLASISLVVAVCSSTALAMLRSSSTPSTSRSAFSMNSPGSTAGSRLSVMVVTGSARYTLGWCAFRLLEKLATGRENHEIEGI